MSTVCSARQAREPLVDSEDSFDSLYEWTHGNGGFLDPRLRIERDKIHGGRSLVVEKGVLRQVALITLPWSSCFSAARFLDASMRHELRTNAHQTGVESRDLTDEDEFLEDLELACALLLAFYQADMRAKWGTDGTDLLKITKKCNVEWSTFLRSLPSMESMSLLARDACPRCTSRIHDASSGVAGNGLPWGLELAIVHRAEAVLRRCPSLSGCTFTTADVEYCLRLVWSRAIATRIGKRGVKKLVLMFPVADMAQHSTSPNARFDIDETNQRVSLVTRADVDAGGQVYISYGTHHSLQHFALRYQFVPQPESAIHVLSDALTLKCFPFQGVTTVIRFENLSELPNGRLQLAECRLNLHCASHETELYLTFRPVCDPFLPTSLDVYLCSSGLPARHILFETVSVESTTHLWLLAIDAFLTVSSHHSIDSAELHTGKCCWSCKLSEQYGSVVGANVRKLESIAKEALDIILNFTTT